LGEIKILCCLDGRGQLYCEHAEGLVSGDHARRHDPLLAAIRSNDPDAAAAIQEHILGFGEQVRRLSPTAAAHS
jgi:DNA-binding GntR family transcriptional regulator